MSHADTLQHAFSTGFLAISGQIDIHCMAQLMQLFKDSNICIFSITLNTEPQNTQIQTLFLQYDPRESKEFTRYLCQFLEANKLQPFL